jgi:hypothetical protein
LYLEMKMKLRLKLGLFLLAASVMAGAQANQGVRYDNVATLDTGRPAQGIGIRVCLSGSTGTPCTPLASIFSDSALSVAITQPGLQSDAQGNYNFYSACGTYDIQLTGNGVTTRTMKDVQLGPCGNFNTAAAITSQVKSLKVGTDTAFTAAPRMFWSGTISCGVSFAPCEDSARITPDNAITITRFQVTFLTAPAGCTTNYQVGVRDATSATNITTLTAVNGTSTVDSGSISINVAAGHVLVINNVTAPAGCTTSPGNNSFSVQYKMQ